MNIRTHADEPTDRSDDLVETVSTEAAFMTPATFPALSQIVRLVESSLAARDAITVVAQIAAGLEPIIERTAGQLPPELLRPRPDGYRRIELHHCPLQGYQILAMIWAPGQGTPIHDHEDTWGVEAVYRGRLLVGEFTVVEARDGLHRISPRGAAHLTAGEITTVTPDQQLHLCSNPSKRDVAVSLHIYGRALDVCGVYESADQEGWYERREQRILSE